jgi:hypothetical protein
MLFSYALDAMQLKHGRLLAIRMYERRLVARGRQITPISFPDK